MEKRKWKIFSTSFLLSPSSYIPRRDSLYSIEHCSLVQLQLLWLLLFCWLHAQQSYCYCCCSRFIHFFSPPSKPQTLQPMNNGSPRRLERRLKSIHANRLTCHNLGPLHLHARLKCPNIRIGPVEGPSRYAEGSGKPAEGVGGEGRYSGKVLAWARMPPKRVGGPSCRHYISSSRGTTGLGIKAEGTDGWGWWATR